MENITPQQLMSLFHEKPRSKKPNVQAEWKKTHYKEYPRFEIIQFNKPEKTPDLFEKLLNKRRSVRKFRRKVKLEEISKLLFYSAGLVKGQGDFGKRSYPSGGAKYPLEIYLAANNVDFQKGLYHYNVSENRLEKFPVKISKGRIQKLFFQRFVSQASVIFFITSAIGRSQVKYGMKSLKFSFVEAGHLGQNILLYATKLNLGSCAICGYDGREVEKLLQIDGLSEGIVYVIALG